MIPFYWDDWNLEHATRHSVSVEEAEYVVRHARAPEHVGGGKRRVWGSTAAGRLVQVVFTEIEEDRIDFEALALKDILALADSTEPFVYVIHARDLEADEKRQYHRRRR